MIDELVLFPGKKGEMACGSEAGHKPLAMTVLSDCHCEGAQRPKQSRTSPVEKDEIASPPGEHRRLAMTVLMDRHCEEALTLDTDSFDYAQDAGSSPLCHCEEGALCPTKQSRTSSVEKDEMACASEGGHRPLVMTVLVDCHCEGAQRPKQSRPSWLWKYEIASQRPLAMTVLMDRHCEAGAFAGQRGADR